MVQAEDELASIGMVIGAGWAGARAMTATSGPGISLMAEFTGLGYYAEVPAVIFDVQRVGPSTGLPTRTMQGRHPLDRGALARRHPASHAVPFLAEECFSMAIEAFDLAERFQTPVFVMSDLDLGMNNWMSDPFPYPTEPIRRGKVLDAEDLDRLGGFARYKDVDGDGVGYRTLPGTRHPAAAYFTRGSGHNEKAGYSEREDDYMNNMDRLARKFETLRAEVPPPHVELNPNAPRGHHLRRHLPLRGRGKPRPVAPGVRPAKPATCGSRLTRSPRSWRISSAATSGSTSWSRTATPSCCC